MSDSDEEDCRSAGSSAEHPNERDATAKTGASTTARKKKKTTTTTTTKKKKSSGGKRNDGLRREKSGVKDSLEAFLEATKDEDMMLARSKNNHGGSGMLGSERLKSFDDDDDDDESHFYDDDDALTVQSEIPLNRDVLRSARTSSRRSKSRSRSRRQAGREPLRRERPVRRKKKTASQERRLERNKSMGSTDSSTGAPRSERRRKPERSRSAAAGSDDAGWGPEEQFDASNNNNNNNDDGDGSDGEQQRPRSIRNKRSSRQIKPRSSRSVGPAEERRQRTKSLPRAVGKSGSGRRRVPRRNRSAAGGLADQNISKKNGLSKDNKNSKSTGMLNGGGDSNNNNSNNKPFDLASGLEKLDRKGRRDRMKQDYRDGAESVASGRSYRSAHTTATARSSYRQTGLEGGALNAFMMNNENINRQGSRGKMSGGASVVSAPPTADYLQQRRARQDLIMDDAFKDKWKNEEKAEKAARDAERERIGEYSSDEDIGTKKKGLVTKMKRAAKKGAKDAAKAVRSPRNAARKAGKIANHVGKETAKLVREQPASIARAVNDTFGDAFHKKTPIKENFEDDIEKEDSDDDDEEEEDLLAKDYDPRMLTDRQKFRPTFAEKLTVSNENIKNTNDSHGRETMLPGLNLTDAASASKKYEWWEL